MPRATGKASSFLFSPKPQDKRRPTLRKPEVISSAFHGAYHAGWTNGYWHGNVNNLGWGAVAALTPWGLGSGLYNWGYSSYSNPYYYAEPVAQPIVFEQTSPTGEVQNVSVQPTSYDYSQPLDTQSPPPAEDVANPAVAKFDEARAAFGTGDYATALRLTDEVLKSLPNDATLHEFRALIFFAIGKYDLAAGPLYAVLSVGPGWDWTTMSGLYPSIDVYTAQLRKLEAFVKANPKSVDGRFVLAYHYLTQGNNDAGVAMLKQIVAQAPNDTLSAQLLRQFSPPTASGGTNAPAPTAAAAAAPALNPGQPDRSLDGSPQQRHDDQPHSRRRRHLHLERRRQGQDPADRRQVVAGQ